MSSVSDKPTLIEREINELLQTLIDIEKLGSKRRFIAYGLKLIAGGSGLVIALDVFGTANKWLGAAIMVAVLLDTVFANYERLVGETRAAHAARLKRRTISSDHNRALNQILIQLKKHSPESTEYQAANAAKDSLENKTHTLLQKTVSQIDKALAELDLKALKSISLEAERSAIDR